MLLTDQCGIGVLGIATAHGFSASGVVTATTGDFVNLDVDGETDLDDLSVAGVSTFSDTLKVGAGVTMHPSGESAFAGITTFAGGLHIPMCQSLIIGPNALYGKIDYPSGTSELRFTALNQMRFRVWDGGGYED